MRPGLAARARFGAEDFEVSELAVELSPNAI
jgi:hypothetical protein